MKTVKYSLKSTLPILAGYLVLGMGFGILLTSKGYSWWWSLLMSLTIYAGSMQYAAINLLTSGASFIATALMTLFINVRHIFYGITMLSEYKNTGVKKPYLIFSLTDETFSLVCSPNLPSGVDKQKYFLSVSLFNQFYWVAGSVLGSVLGNIVPFDTTGIDFAMTALFVVIFVEQWEKSKNHFPAIIGVVCSVVSLLIFGADDFLIPAMISITLSLFVGRKWLEEE
jgi:4-azaleucine resistance transporter AzlC